MTKTKLICQGFTTHGRLDLGGGESTLMVTSFNASMQRQVIQSTGLLAYARSVDGIARTRGPVVLNTALVSLNVGTTPTPEQIRDMVFFLKNRRNDAARFTARDSGIGVSWQFTGYITAFSFNIGLDSAVISSFSMMTERGGLSYEYDGTRESLPRIGTGMPQPHNIPYWGLEVLEEGSPLEGVTEASFSFTQPVTPRHECGGEGDDSAPVASYMLFGLPQLTMSVTQVMNPGGKIETRDLERVSMRLKDSIGVKGIGTFLSVSDALANSYAVNLGGTFQTRQTEYYIRGYLR